MLGKEFILYSLKIELCHKIIVIWRGQPKKCNKRSTGKESTCQCRRHGFNHWFGKIPRASGQLSPCATATEPVSCNYQAYMLQQLKPACVDPCSALREDMAMRSLCTIVKSSPHSPKLEKGCVEQ